MKKPIKYSLCIVGFLGMAWAGYLLMKGYRESREEALKEGEVIFVLQYVSYFDGARNSMKIDDLDACSPSQTERLKKYLDSEYVPNGFVFDVLGPKEHRGKFFTMHHDGDQIVSSEEFGKPGDSLFFRSGEKFLSGPPFSFCSMYLWPFRRPHALFLDPVYDNSFQYLPD